VIKINFHGGKNHFPPVSPANFRAGYAYSFDWLAFAVIIKLVWWAAVPGKWRLPNFTGTARHLWG